MQYWGNKDILRQEKTAFLCSQKYSADVVLKSYDWAKAKREEGTCIICSNHSQIEKDVFDILIKGKQPLILILPRNMKTRWEPEIVEAVNKERLLVIAPFDNPVKRVTRETATKKNETIIELANHITVGYKTPDGQLDRLLAGKEIKTLNKDEVGRS